MDDYEENFSTKAGHAFELTQWTWCPPGTRKPMVYLAPDVVARGLTEKLVLEFRAFEHWWKTLNKSMHGQIETTHEFHQAPYHLRYIRVQTFDAFGRKGQEQIYFMKIFAQVENKNKQLPDGLPAWLPGVVSLRGGCVAILMILRPSDAPLERYVIMTEQARVAGGSLAFLEIPAGMLGDEDEPVTAAIRYVEGEADMVLREDELINMTQLVSDLGNDNSRASEDLPKAVYPSPGGSDEYMHIFYWEKEMDRVEIEMLKDRLTGDRNELKRISIRLVEYDELIERAGRDMKTLAAWALYERLKRVYPRDFGEYERMY